MSTLKIILAKDMSTLGEEGDIKIVKRGYARNFLFPRGLAVECSKANLADIEQKKDYFDKRKLEKKEFAQKLKELLESKKIKIVVAAGDKGRLFGTVTSLNIAEELNKDEDIKKFGYVADKKHIELHDHIKFQGSYKYRIHLYQDVYAAMEVTVEAKVEKQKEEKGKRKKYDRPRRNYRSDENSESEVTPENEASNEASLETHETEESKDANE